MGPTVTTDIFTGFFWMLTIQSGTEISLFAMSSRTLTGKSG